VVRQTAPASPRRALAGRLLASALVAVALLAGACTPGEGPPAPAVGADARASTSATPTVDEAAAREGALTDLLRRRSAAVLGRDRDAFAATLDDPRSGFGLRQLELFDALGRLPLRTFAYGVPEPAPALGDERAAQVGPGAWVAKVTGRYALAGYDRGEREFETHLTVVRRAGGWRLADDSDGGSQPQLWDLPDLTVVRSRTTLVVGSGPASRLREYLRLGDEAVSRVKQVWTRPWSGRLVLVVPRTSAQMAELVGQDATGVEQVAAVTDGALGADGRAGADRVVVNPAALARLQPDGRRVVVTHEATHVAVRWGTTAPVPLWLSEGMADFVGYRGLGLSRTRVAAPLLDQVRAGGAPRRLPQEGDFDPGRSTIAPHYNAAWLAVSLIADQHGTAGLVRFYAAAATAGSASASGEAAAADADERTAAAFRDVLGTSEAAFTRQWSAYVGRLARS
jgi:hypothetical protein